MRIGQTSFVLFNSKVITSALGFLATIYFARELGAGVLGIYFLVLGLVTWLEVVADPGISEAVTKRISEGGHAGEYALSSLSLLLPSFLIVSGVLVLGRSHLDAYVGRPALAVVVGLLAATLAYKLVAGLLKGNHLVHVYAGLSVVKSLGRTIAQVAAVFAGFGLVGLVTGYAFGYVLFCLFGLLGLSVRYRRPTKHSTRDLLAYARYAWLGGLRSRTFNWMDVVILGLFVPSSMIGVYGVAWNVAAFLKTFSNSISETLFPEMSRLAADDPRAVSELVEDALAYAGLILLPGLIGGAVIGDRLLAIYGSEFAAGATVLWLLIAACLLYAYQKQLVNTLNAIDRPDRAFRINAVFVGSNLLFNLVLVWRIGWVGAALATLVSAAISLGHAYLELYRLVGFALPLGEIGRQAFAAGIMGGIVLLTRHVVQGIGPFGNDVFLITFLVFTGAGVYFLSLFALSVRFRTTISRNVPTGLLSYIDGREGVDER
ncbi:oligosaccharide flippase family protein [Natronorarus salvus]|uniref:oligosaccharide flippase family protein n=1 Tax=Natronorarus salvus TaxID=3117733 RepID=UPI002F2637E2